MKKNILMLINGFGVSQKNSFDVYSPELMPNMDQMTKENIFLTIENKFIDYKAGYRSFSIGVKEALTYGLVENYLNEQEETRNQVLKYIINEMMKNNSRLHIFVYYETQSMIPSLKSYISEIRKYTQNKIFVHVIMQHNSLNDFKEIERGFTSLSYELGEEVKIGLVIGETSMYDYTGTKDIVRNLITEFGEKWTDIPKKIQVLESGKTFPRDTRTFSVNNGYALEETDQFLFFNFSSVDITGFRKELFSQKYKQVDYSKIKMYSLFPLKSETPIHFMYNYALSSTNMLNSLNNIGASALVLDLKERCSYINYYLTGLKNETSETIKYIPTDDGFIYEPQKVLDVINGYQKELYIINYNIEDVKTFEQLKDKLSKIDTVMGTLKDYCINNQAALFVSSLYGMQKDLYDEKQVLRNINFYSRVPLVIMDRQIGLSQYTVDEGSLFDLSNTILKNINPQHKIQGMIKKKTSLLSFLYKKPKEIKK